MSKSNLVSPATQEACNSLPTRKIERLIAAYLNAVSLGLFAVLCLLFNQNDCVAASLSFSYNLTSASVTSAGAYKPDGTLVRTLWNNKPKPSGANTGTWDGLDDAGQPAPAGSYQIKVLNHNVSYTWQGTIGNTSTNQTGTTTHRGFSKLQDIAISGTNMFAASGYGEKQALWRRMSTSNPNSVSYWSDIYDQSRQFQYAATDGTNVYLANTGNGWIGSWPSFVTAYKVSDNSAVAFSSGVTAPAGGGGTSAWPGVIDLTSGQANIPTGIAVQTSGSFLFVSHSGLNQVKVFNKTTGALVNTVSITSPGRLATTTDGGLWVISTEGGYRAVRRYNVDSSGDFSYGPVVTGDLKPLAVAVSPDNSTILIAYGGTWQQVVARTNASSGSTTYLWSLGQNGGYNSTNGPNVTNDKFMFDITGDDGVFTEGTFLTFQSDGSFWVGDPGNERYLHFSAAQAYLGQIGYLSANRVSTVCAGTPTRVFAKGWMEFAVDYAQTPANGWTLVKNWKAGMPANFTSNPYGGMGAVVLLSNGRTYAMVTNSTTGNRAILELTSTGARQTGIEFPANQTLHEDGSLRYQTVSGPLATYYKRAITGFDASNNPLWGTATVLATAPNRFADPVNGYGWNGPAGPRFPTTSGNVMITSNVVGYGANVNHLGGVNVGGSSWLWKGAPPARYFDDSGSVGVYCTYPANTQFVVGHNILFGCHGEGYTPPNGATGEANQYLHFWDNGLLIGRFGNEFCGIDFSTGVVAGTAGNSFTPYMVQVGSNTYVWHNDEGHAGGLHRWIINNLSSVNEQTVNVTLPSTGGSGTGLTGQYFSGTSFNTLNVTRTDQQVDFNWAAGSPSSSVPVDNFSVRWTGLVQPLYSQAYTFYTQSDDGVRLWIDNQLVIDNWTDHGSTENPSAPITMTANSMHTIRMEFYEAAGGAEAGLKWSSTSQAKGIIPMQQLYPSDAQAINCGGPTVGRFQADPYGYTGPVIVTTTSAIDTSGVVDPAPTAVYQQQHQRAISYSFTKLAPLTNYKVRLHLAEIQSAYATTGARVFKIRVNDLDYALPDVDIYAATGATNKALVREFVATSDSGGNISLYFQEATWWVLVAGIEVQRDVSNAGVNPSFATIGLGTGLKGQYYSGTNINSLVATRTDPEVNFKWDNAGPLPSVGPHSYTVRWTGKAQSVEAGTYTFAVNATDGAKLWVNNLSVPLIDSWSAAGYHTATINLNASTKYDIKLEYLDNASSSEVALSWTRPGGIIGILQQSQLYPAP